MDNWGSNPHKWSILPGPRKLTVSFFPMKIGPKRPQKETIRFQPHPVSEANSLLVSGGWRVPVVTQDDVNFCLRRGGGGISGP